MTPDRKPPSPLKGRTPPDSDGPGRSSFGRYVQPEKLGAGGMGEVWKAWDPELQRWVALKFLRGSDGPEIARFQREARIAAGLAHPNIAAIYEVGQADGRHFLAMQLVAGTTLRPLAKGDPRLLAGLLRDAARAVHHAHRQGVVHRDLKPDNLMVEDGRLFVMDFGLARPAEGASDLSASGAILGTPAYMPPEQARGDRVDARSDVYALGATLYELLSGRKPIQGRTVMETLQRIQDQEPGPLRGTDPELATIVAKCLEKDPARRYPDAAELADDLDRWLRGEAILARGASPGYRALKFLRRRKLALAALGAAAIAAVLLPMWISSRREAGTARDALDEARRLLPLQGELERLELNAHVPGFRLADEDFARYERLVAELRRARPGAKAQHLIGRLLETLADSPGAEAAYQAALAADPGHGESAVALARMAVEGAFLDAGVRYDDPYWIAQVAARRTEAESRLARALDSLQGESRDLDKARALLLIIRNKGGSTPVDLSAYVAKWAGKPLGEEFLLLDGSQRGRADLMEKACSGMPSHPASLTLYASQLRSNPDLSLKHLDRALQVNPRYWPAALFRAILRNLREDRAGAVADYRTVLRWNPRYLPARWGLLSCLSSIPDYPALEQEVRGALDIEPENPTTLMHRITLERHRGRLEIVKEITEGILRRHPDFAPALMERGRAAMNRGEWAAACADFEAAIRSDPSEAGPHHYRGWTKFRQGDIPGALEDLDTAIRMDPRLAESRYARAFVFRHLERWKEALADCTEALRLKPSYPGALEIRGQVHLALGNLAQAEADYTKLIEIQPEGPVGWTGRARVLERTGHRADAMVHLERALRVKPDHVEALCLRATLRASAGDLPGCLADFEAAIRAEPGDPNVRHSRANVLFQLGRFAESLPDYDETLRLHPGRVEALLERGRVHAALQHVAEARRDLEAFLRAAPRDHPQRPEASRALAALPR